MRTAAEMLKRPLVYYADIPYLLKNPQELSPKTAGMKESVQLVSESGLKSWIEAIEAYTSQMSSVFDAPAVTPMPEKMRAYWSGRQGIALWKFE